MTPLRFHTPLVEPDMQISRIRLSDKAASITNSHIAVDVGWSASMWHRFRDVLTHNSGVVRLAPISGLSASSVDGP